MAIATQNCSFLGHVDAPHLFRKDICLYFFDTKNILTVSNNLLFLFFTLEISGIYLLIQKCVSGF